jgi:hypothetical protein
MIEKRYRKTFSGKIKDFEHDAPLESWEIMRSRLEKKKNAE